MEDIVTFFMGTVIWDVEVGAKWEHRLREYSSTQNLRKTDMVWKQFEAFFLQCGPPKRGKTTGEGFYRKERKDQVRTREL